ncbi:MAG TPA: FtsK/SpoIIIE domain-containing protein [Phycisphaerae bacterium]|nr:FtsK/SpoIIIE domain-containing protein [Phycisphaerae bacterium]HOJ75929.1 FtsK/SpoIIIE domain-containing protein [Phycisphaerae bacterium]HOM52295.1 FtsK/SpoIIIE domain-containing protein [Phycisphaerae bacterium]HON65581.1 FtsK/SpoIIIE domain-containing protein [Phycisphaerae bacterium]HPP24921.1 FtsK/SpoIIIE domain-containing protein [Phycisphaerae bacterium]
MHEPTASTLDSVIRKNQLALQREALRAFIELSAEVAEPENARLEKEYASARERLDRKYGTLIERLEEEYRSADREQSDKLREQLSQARAQHEAQLTTLDFEYRKRCQKVTDDTETALREVRKQAEQDAWLAESVCEAEREQIQRDRETFENDAPKLMHRLDNVQARADWLLHHFGYRPAAAAADARPSEPTEPASEESPAEHMEALYAQCLEQLDHLERMTLPRLVTGLAPVGLAVVICGSLLALAAALSLAVPETFSFLVTGPVAGALGIVISVAGWRTLSKLAQARLGESASHLERTLQEARVAVDRHVQTQRERFDHLNEKALHKRATEVSRIEALKERQIAELEKHRTGLLARLEDTYLKAKADFSQRRDSEVGQIDEQGHRAIADLRRDYEHRLARLADRRTRQLAALDRKHAAARNALDEKWREGLDRIHQLIEQATRLRQSAPDWDDPSWQDWRPHKQFTPAIRFGEWSIDMSRLAPCVRQRLALNNDGAAAAWGSSPIRVPAVLELPDRGSLFVQAGSKTRGAAVAALQAAMVRLLTSLPPGRVHFTIIDPVGLGENFAGFMHLADYDDALVGGRIWTEKVHIEQRLGDLTAHMENVIQKYLRNEYETIDAYNVQAGELAEPYRFLVIADFPANFSEEAIHRLTSIVSSGPRCGVYTLIAQDTRLPLPPGCHVEDLQTGSVHVADDDGGGFAWQDDILRRFPLQLDVPPDQDRLTRLMHSVGQAAGRAKRVEVPFDFITPPADQLWSADSRQEIRVPVGRTGAVRLQELRLGRGVAQHALIAGKTGSGKSTLLHVLITNLVLWYSPDEVEFYLIDFKKGVEFKTYATHQLPHARAIAIESDREFGLSVLHRLDAEMSHRGELFRAAGVQDLPAYRDATGRKMPRTLLVVDEFQIFFSEDDKIAQDAAILLDRLVRQGRAFGIHVILGSQTLGGTSGLARSTIGQMAVRIALQCSEVDSQLILDDGNSAARLLSRPGEAIYNDAGGLLQGNSPFQTAWLSDETRDGYLDRVTALARERANVGETIVFEGNAPADLRRNRMLMDLLRNGCDRSAAGRKPQEAAMFWLGEAVAIKDPTAAVLRRLSGANVLLIGQRDDASLAIMSAGMIGLAAQHAPSDARFVILDGGSPDSPQMLQQIAAILPHECKHVEYRNVPDSITELATELRRRQAEGTPADPSIYVLIHGLQRYRVLRKSEDAFSFSFNSGEEDKPPATDKLFAEILREGPAVGIHVIAWADTPATVERTFERQTLREFDNRVLFQMSAADSSNLIDSPLANRLGFYRALFFSEEQGLLEKFRPYSLPDRDLLEEVRAQFARSRTA